MSTEQILLFVALIVLPLVQYLVRAVRQQQGHEPARADDQPPPARRPTLPQSQLPPEMESRAVSGVITPERKAPVDAARPLTPPIRPRTRPAMAPMGLGGPRDLRRAIVLMTVIEPCRAVQPHDYGKGGDRLPR